MSSLGPSWLRRVASVFDNPTIFVDLYTGHLDRLCCLTLRNGCRLEVRPRGQSAVGDIDVVEELLVGDVYGLSQGYLPGTQILDIGAHIGVYAVAAASHAAVRRVVAVEPEASNFEMLLRNKRLNPHLPLTAICLALGDAPGRGQVLRSARNTGGHRVVPELTDQHSRMRCDIVTLESAIRLLPLGVVDVLKIDCEGGEAALLRVERGALAGIARIHLEIHDVPRLTLTRALRIALSTAGHRLHVTSVAATSEGTFVVCRTENKSYGKSSGTREVADVRSGVDRA